MFPGRWGQEGGGFLGEGPPDKVLSTQLLACLSPLRDWDPLPPPGKSSLGRLARDARGKVSVVPPEMMQEEESVRQKEQCGQRPGGGHMLAASGQGSCRVRGWAASGSPSGHSYFASCAPEDQAGLGEG